MRSLRLCARLDSSVASVAWRCVVQRRSRVRRAVSLARLGRDDADARLAVGLDEQRRVLLHAQAPGKGREGSSKKGKTARGGERGYLSVGVDRAVWLVWCRLA
eukprot:4328178-Pleurochrysis_carterae.AAC.11